MAVGVDEARDDEPAFGVDHLGVARRSLELTADVGDDTVADEHVAVGLVAERRVDGDDVAALDEQFGGNDGSPVFR